MWRTCMWRTYMVAKLNMALRANLYVANLKVANLNGHAKFRIRGSLWDIWFWILPFYAMRLRYFRTVLEEKKNSKSHRVAISMKSLEITSRCYFTEVARNHIALLIHRSYSKITSRCYFKEVTRKSHQVAISPKLLEITSRCYFNEVTRSSIEI